MESVRRLGAGEQGLLSPRSLRRPRGWPRARRRNDRGGERLSVGFIDLYKHGLFVLEAKQGSDDGSTKTGKARRGTPAWHASMQTAFGQAFTKVAQFLMRCLFTMFVEDIELLQPPIFTAALKDHWVKNPESFPGEVE